MYRREHGAKVVPVESLHGGQASLPCSFKRAKMVLITAITAIAWLWAWTCLSSKSHFVSSLTVYTPEYESACPGLKARLSPGATILLPDNPEFANATSRWGDYAKPDITVVVEVATEGDVSETVSNIDDHLQHRCQTIILIFKW